jgi:CSLREA domain-containing protein
MFAKTSFDLRFSARGNQRRRRAGRGLTFESLETRRLMARDIDIDLPFRDLVIVVNSADDVDDGQANAEHTSLREAINAMNAAPVLALRDKIIQFDIEGPTTIQPLSPLPSITTPVTIDGATQDGYSNAPVIHISGGQSNAGAGLHIAAAGVVLRGLEIAAFPGYGVMIEGPGGNVIESCVIRGNNLDGVAISNSPQNTIGGAGVGNVIAGNGDSGVAIVGPSASGNQVLGNAIGVLANRSFASPNGQGVFIFNAGQNIVGGDAASERNVISGNEREGVLISSGDGNIVQGNFIGPDGSGAAKSVDIRIVFHPPFHFEVIQTPRSNARGVVIEGDSRNNLVGGIETTTRNLIGWPRDSKQRPEQPRRRRFRRRRQRHLGQSRQWPVDTQRRVRARQPGAGKHHRPQRRRRRGDRQ